MFRYKYKKVGVLPIQIVKSNVSSIGPSSERNIKHVLCFSVTKVIFTKFNVIFLIVLLFSSMDVFVFICS